MNTVQVEIFALKNVCSFSNPANIEFFANGNYLRFFIPFESLKGKRLRKLIFAIMQPRKKTAFKVMPKKSYVYSTLVIGEEP